MIIDLNGVRYYRGQIRCGQAACSQRVQKHLLKAYAYIDFLFKHTWLESVRVFPDQKENRKCVSFYG